MSTAKRKAFWDTVVREVKEEVTRECTRKMSPEEVWVIERVNVIKWLELPGSASKKSKLGNRGSHNMSQEFKIKLQTSTREKIKRFDALRGEFHIECPLSLPKVCLAGFWWRLMDAFWILAEPVFPDRKTFSFQPSAEWYRCQFLNELCFKMLLF